MKMDEIHTVGEVYERCGLRELLLRKGFGATIWHTHVGEAPYYHKLNYILKHATRYLGNMLVPVNQRQFEFIREILLKQYEPWTFPVVDAPAIYCPMVVFFVGEKDDLLRIRMVASVKNVDFKQFHNEEAYFAKGIKEFYDILS